MMTWNVSNQLCVFLDLCKKQGVKGYPTFKYYKKGQFFAPYEGSRTTEDVLKFLNSPPEKSAKEEL